MDTKLMLNLAREIELIAPMASRLSERPQLRGIWVCVGSPNHGVLLTCREGVLDKEINNRCFDLCREKVIRLLQCQTHVSSFQSRLAGQGRYGGAIRTDTDWVMGVSSGADLLDLKGEQADEALAAAIGNRVRLLTVQSHWYEIQAASSNPFMQSVGVIGRPVREFAI